MEFIYCLLYLLFISLLIYFVGRVYPRKAINPNVFPFCTFKKEKNGKIYQKFKVRKLKKIYPDASKLAHKIIAKIPEKSLKSPTEKQLTILIYESCVAEITHVVAIILGAFCPIISITHGTILSTLYILFNLPAIIIQRFNRPCYKSALLKITQRGI